MSTTSPVNQEKVSKKYCGIKGLRIRLNSRRLSIQRLKIKFIYLFNRWRCSYRNFFKLLRRNLSRGKRSEKEKRDFVQVSKYHVDYYSGGRRSLTHSNSFCSEAIADCVDFIKRNSVSADDDRKPMLNQG